MTPRAPVGYAGSVAAYIARLVAHDRQNWPSATIQRQQHWRTLDATSEYARASGDGNAAIAALWRASQLAGGGDAYSPGARQVAVLQSVGLNTLNDVPGPAAVFAALVTAALDDVASESTRRINRAEGERAKALNGLRRSRRAPSTAPKYSSCGRSLRKCAAITTTSTAGIGWPGDTAAEPEAVTLPTGVRQRGAGFQIYWRDENGRQLQEGGFRTVEDAVAARVKHLEDVAARKAGTVTAGAGGGHV